MILRNRIVYSTTGILVFLLSILEPVESQRVRSQYVGVSVCRKCHGSEAMGNQYRIWEASPHASAFIMLRLPKAKQIAKKVSVQNPSEDPKCLKCHTTGGGRSEVTRDEGVGCEACHGPGSRYFEFSNHASYLDRESAYKKAIGLGMYPVRGINGIKFRERMCKRCHRDQRPCFPEDADEQKRRRLSLSIIADLPSKLKHPLRR